MKTQIKIKCTRCKKAPIVKLKNAIKLKNDYIEYCPNCLTELAYVDGYDFPKYNLWTIRTQTAKLIK